MFILLSPAKKLHDEPPVPAVEPTLPTFIDEARVLTERARELGLHDLKRLMNLSDNLASLNLDRFGRWTSDHRDGTPAILTFAGDVYVGLDAGSLTDDDLRWAQDHVGILSGLYGLLRPLDRIHPYRLEMGSQLSNARGKNLYEFWADTLAQRVAELTAEHDDPTVLNLASQEYAKAVPPAATGLRWITPVFQDVKDGKARTLSFYAKTARGAMARWAIEHRVTRAEELRSAEVLGYRLDAAASTEDRWVFRRAQPAGKAA